MTKNRWKGLLKSISNHIDPEKEEQLGWLKIGKKLISSIFCEENENQVKGVVKLIKNTNLSNKERNLKTRSEVINLVDDLQKQYESLYSLYEDLREEVKKNVCGGDDDSSTSYNSDSESYYSPGEFNVRNSKNSNAVSKFSDSDNQDSETSDLEDTILKDKLTSSSEVKKNISSDWQSTFNRPQEFGEILKDLRIQGEESENTSQKLAQIKDLEGQVASLRFEISTLCTQKKQLEEQVESKSDEAMQMKEKISRLEARTLEIEAKSKENESQFYSFRKQTEVNKQQSLSRISELVAQANGMQLELNNLKRQKIELEGRLSHETKKWSSQVKGLMKQVDSLQHQLMSVNSQKATLELELKKKSAETAECLLQIEDLRNELSLHEQGTEEEKEGLKVQVNDLELEIHSLSSSKSDLEEQVKKINCEALQSNAEKEKLHGKISQLQTALAEKENELSNESMKIKSLTEEVKNLERKLETLKNERNHLQEELEVLQNERNHLQVELEGLEKERNHFQVELEALQNERNNFQVELEALQNETNHLQEELEASQNKQKELQMELAKEKEECSEMEKQNSELTNTIAEQQKTLSELEAAMSKLKDGNEQAQSRTAPSRPNLQIVERKVEELAEEFRKQFEDQCRILSRRIRVAEQLHAENKECYLKIKEMYEQENKDLKERAGTSGIDLKNVKDMTVTANDLLNSLDSVALKFEECSGNFLNRISKASCELKFVHQWAMRKNTALLHVKEDLDCSLAQLDDKEGEILVFREKVLKSENKVRELEKLIKEKEDGMLGLREEKREAIRQLCVWIDYHRGRSEYYKKMLSETNT